MILMTSNQWQNDKNTAKWAEMGMDCSYTGRAGGLYDAYTSVLPDAIGVQETSRNMQHLLLDKMFHITDENGEVIAKYDCIDGTDTPIWYRSDRLIPVESAFLLYPEHIEGFEGMYNNHGSKSYSVAVFKCREDGKIFVFMSTHLWWKSSNPNAKHYMPMSDEAREWQLRLCCKTVDALCEKYNCPGFIVGDYNAKMNSKAITTAIANGYVEAHDITVGERNDLRGHHPCNANGFDRGDPGTFEQAIDHILVRNPEMITVNSYKRYDDPAFDCISDHYPLYIDVTL